MRNPPHWGVPAVQSPSRFWSYLLSGQDPIGEIPIERFDVDELYEEDRSVPGRVYVREGGFIPGVEDSSCGVRSNSDPNPGGGGNWTLWPFGWIFGLYLLVKHWDFPLDLHKVKLFARG